MTNKSQPTSHQEVQVQKPTETTNLSDTARLVKGVFDFDVYPELRAAISNIPDSLTELGKSIVEIANKLFGLKLPKKDPKVTDFNILLRETQSKIYKKAKSENRNNKQLAVVSNFFPQLIAAIEKSGNTPAPQPPVQQPDAKKDKPMV